MEMKGLFCNFRVIPILYIVKYDTDMELKAILFKRYPSLYLLLIFICGCQQTADSSKDRQESVPVSPIQTEHPHTEDTVTVDTMVHDRKIPEKMVDTLSQRAEQTAKHAGDIPMFISARELQDTLLKTIVLDRDSLSRERVNLSVLTSAGMAPKVEEKIFVRMYNYSSDTLLTGLNYKVEFLDNGKWVMVSPPKNVGQEDIGYMLNPFIARDFPILLFSDQHTYRPGKYRVSKEYRIFRHPAPRPKMEVSTGFEIE